MGYIGATELSLILPANVSIGTNTVPITLGEVGSIITEVSAELDSAAAKAGYAVPIACSASLSYELMQLNTKRGAGAYLLDIIFNMGAPGQTRSMMAADFKKAYDDFLKALRNEDILLVDAPLSPGIGGRQLPRSFEVTQGISASPAIPREYVW